MNSQDSVNAFADKIMQMIDEDISNEELRNSNGERMPATVSSFSELHEYCDANDYYVQAGVPWETQAEKDLTNEVGSEVTRRLQARTGNALWPDLRKCASCGIDLDEYGRVRKLGEDGAPLEHHATCKVGDRCICGRLLAEVGGSNVHWDSPDGHVVVATSCSDACADEIEFLRFQDDEGRLSAAAVMYVILTGA